MSIHYLDDFSIRFGIKNDGSSVPSIEQRSRVLLLYIVSYSVWVGFPIFFLFIINGVRLILKALKNIEKSFSGYSIAILLTFLMLFISGEAAGEVARQWAFTISLVVIFASTEIHNLFNGKKRWFFASLVIQLITVYLTFKFQDFVT